MNSNRIFSLSPKRNSTGSCQGGAQPKASNTLTISSTIDPRKGETDPRKGETLPEDKTLLDRKDKSFLSSREFDKNEYDAVLTEYTPDSWFHDKGAFKAKKRVLSRFPEISGNLLITLTVNPNLFKNPSSAFDYSRDRIRRVFYHLRKGVYWKGKFYQLNAPYWVKVEFHKNEFSHFHIVFLTNRFLPGELINHLWKIGRTNIKRIDLKGINYLLKYITKNGELPNWVKERKRLRITQASKGFYIELEQKKKESIDSIQKRQLKDNSLTIGERMEKWKRIAVFQNGKRFRQISLFIPFREILGRNLVSIAQQGRYLGNGMVKINKTEDIILWLIKPIKKMEKPRISKKAGFTSVEWWFPVMPKFGNEKTAVAFSFV